MTQEDWDKKALKEEADMMHYVAEEKVKKAPYDVTRNAIITKVYYAQDLNTIIGYDINVDDKKYTLTKESGKGIVANENDVVKAHFPCNNSNNIYLSYPHDPEDFIKYFLTNESAVYIMYYNSERYEHVVNIDLSLTFPATTKQYSSVIQTIDIHLPDPLGVYSFEAHCDNGVDARVNSSQVGQTTSIDVKFSNENPTTTSPVTKIVNVYIKAMGIVKGFVPQL